MRVYHVNAPYSIETEDECLEETFETEVHYYPGSFGSYYSPPEEPEIDFRSDEVESRIEAEYAARGIQAIVTCLWDEDAVAQKLNDQEEAARLAYEDHLYDEWRDRQLGDF